MTAPVRPNPLDVLLSQSAASAPSAPSAPSGNPLDRLLDPNAATHAAYKSGALQRQITNANEADQAQVPDHPGWQALSEALETPMAGLPGGKLLLSKIQHDSGAPGTMADAMRSVNAQTSDVPYASALGRGIGAALSVPLLPSSGVAAGATYGALDQLLNNNPNSGAITRTAGALPAAIAGGMAGGVAERGITTVRALLPEWLGGTGAASTQLLNRRATRLAADQSLASPSYATAADQGQRYYVDLGNREQDVANAIQRGTAPAPLALPAPGRSEVARAEAARMADLPPDTPSGAQPLPPRPPPALPSSGMMDALANFRARSAAVVSRNEGTVAQQMARQALERDAAYNSLPQLPSALTQGPVRATVPAADPIPIQLRAANDVSVRTPDAAGDVAPAAPQSVPSPPGGAIGLRNALSAPGIAPYAQLARSFAQNQGADDATVARETYKLMSEAQGKKVALTSKGDFAAAPAGQLQSLGILKGQLSDAADQVMPDFSAAVDQHRILSAPITATKQGYGLGQTIVNGPPSVQSLGEPPLPNGRVPDPNVFLTQTLPAMTTDEARATQGGLLGSIRSRGMGGASPNPLRGFGILRNEPTLRALLQVDAAANPATSSIQRVGGLPIGTLPNNLPDAAKRSLLALLQAKTNP